MNYDKYIVIIKLINDIKEYGVNMNKKRFLNGFTMVEIIICLILLVLVGTIGIIVVKKVERNSTHLIEIPNVVKDSISIYVEKYKEKMNYNEYCNEEEIFNCSYVTYKELIEQGLIDEKSDNGYNDTSCFKLSKTEEGLINITEECKNNVPVIILTKSSENIDMGESRILKDYIKNVNPSDGTLTVKINNNDESLEYDVSALSSGTYNIEFSIKNNNNEIAKKTLLLTVNRGTIADIIKPKLPDCVKNEDGYDEDLCAFKGENPENYFWYSGFTWRIIGINKDGTVKMVTQNPVGILSWGEDKRSYESSFVRKWLNELDSTDDYDGIFYNALDKPAEYLEKSLWDISSKPEVITMSTFNDYVGMITEREYKRASSHASEVSKQNYLNIKSEYMTITLSGWDSDEIYVRNIDEFGNPVFRTQTSVYGNAHSNVYINGVSYPPNSSHPNNQTNGFSPANPEGVRPVVNLKKDLSVSGSGTLSDPFKIDSETSGSVNSYLKNRYAGEYITFSGLTWRIMETGDTTKIILNDFMKNGNSYVKKSFSTQPHIEYYERAYKKNTYYSKDRYIQNARYSPTDSTNIGYYLNNTFYNSLSQKSWIVETNFPNSRHGAYIKRDYPYTNDYRYALTEVQEQKESTKYWTTIYYFTPVKAKIGLSSIGQLFSGDDVRVRNVCVPNNNSYVDCYKATMTQDSNNISYPLIVQRYDGTANGSCSANGCTCIYRPITTLKSSIKIAGGSGTPNDPYTLKS